MVWLLVMVANFMYFGGEQWEAKALVHMGKRSEVQEMMLDGHRRRVGRFLGVVASAGVGAKLRVGGECVAFAQSPTEPQPQRRRPRGRSALDTGDGGGPSGHRPRALGAIPRVGRGRKRGTLIGARGYSSSWALGAVGHGL